ncbi:hypothetical protein PENSPDRAFT_758998 [Peniophora sp. CONT]|nr:hypothetical protein PENSPDRAFT_758998 [Peniophora sp. CONT]
MPRIILRVPKRLRLAPRALLATMRRRPAQVTEDNSATPASAAVAAAQNDVVPALTLLSHSASPTAKLAHSRHQSNRRELTKDALLLVLEALVQSADAFPPLKSVVGGLLFFVTQVEMVSSNKEDVQRIYAQIDAMAASLVAAIPDATELSPAAKHAIRALADDVQAVCVDMRTIARQRRLVRFLRAKRNRAQLQGLLKQLEDSNVFFTRTVLTAPATARDPDMPTQTFHKAHLHLSMPIPGHSLVEAVAGGAHYSGVDPMREKRMSTGPHALERAKSAPAERLQPIAMVMSAEDVHKDVVDNIIELYEGRANPSRLSRWLAPHALYDDPWARARGSAEIGAMFRLARAAPGTRASVISHRVLSSATEPQRVVLWMRIAHVIFGVHHTSEAILVIELDGQRRATSIIHTAHGRAPPAYWGAATMRRLGGRAAAALMPFVWLPMPHAITTAPA